jgi:micrococcal nuclease
MSTRQYPATVNRWIDGDTVDLTIDLGFRITHRGHFRLLGVNTPERGQEGWGAAKLFCETAAPAGSTVRVVTHKSDPADKYGRWLADVLAGGMFLNAELVREQLAEPYPVR